MGIISYLFGTESCNGFFHYPAFMSRKEKVRQLDAMLGVINRSGKKKKCDICKRLFNEKMSRWSSDSLSSSICIVCHQKFHDIQCGDYTYSEQKELRELKKTKQIQEKNVR